ncbi:20359_t:CDS:1, partial [Gigaspora margarita]
DDVSFVTCTTIRTTFHWILKELQILRGRTLYKKDNPYRSNI